MKMLNKLFFLWGVFAVLLLFQCEKIKIVPNVQGTPVFFITADIGNGDVFEATAGLNNYRMFTTYEQGTDGVYTFIGTFRKEAGQTDSLASLRVEIRDIGANLAQIDIENALMQSPYGFFNDNQLPTIETTFIASFFALTEGCQQNIPNESLSWDFGDGITATGDNPILVFDDTADRNVTLTLNNGNGFQSSIQQHFSFDNQPSYCSVDIDMQQQQNNVILNAMGTGTAPFSYLWHNGNSSNIIIIPLDSIVGGNYSVTVTDASGCTAIAEGAILGQIGSGFCSPQFTYTTSILIDSLPSSPQFSTVTIIYTDNDGNEFRSDLDEQDEQSFFNIQAMEDFQNNENGEKTKKLNIDFFCQLFSPTQASISIESEGGLIGVAYPD